MSVRDLWAPGQSGSRRLVFLRHGRTAWNLAGRAQGHADVGLDEVGIAEAERAASYLASYEPVFVWSSDLLRARQTAEAMVSLLPDVDLRMDARLREYDVGVRQGMTFAEFEARFPAQFAHFVAGEESAVEGAETTSEVQARMLEVLLAAADEVGVGNTGIVVGHGASLRTGLVAFLGLPLELSEILAGMANCAWAVLELRGARGWQLVDYNARTLPEPVDVTDDPHG